MKFLPVHWLNILLIACFYTTAQGQCIEDTDYWTESWVSCQTSQNPNSVRGDSYWIRYDFSQPEAISDITIWNANRIGESGMGARQINIDYSEDGTTWINNGNFTIPQATELDSYEGVLVTNLGGVFVQSILITILDNHDGSNCVSLAEVKFDIDQEACYGIEDICGVCNGPGITEWFLDSDGDGKGDINETFFSCEQPAGYVLDFSDDCDDRAFSWAEIGPLFVSNGCTGCHGAGALGGLDLRTYESTAMGGNKCGPSLLLGDRLVSVITITGFDGCGFPISGPNMNDRVGGQMDQEELDMIQTWINTGATEDCNSDPVMPIDPCDPIPMLQDYVVSYAGGQDNGIATVIGNEISVSDNAWKATPINYTVTPNTLLNFEFRASEEGEEHSIGMNQDLNDDPGRRFKLYGTQPGPQLISTFNNYDGSGAYVPYSIPIGDYYTGNMNYLFFIMDNDANPSVGDSHFRNITLVEDENANDLNDECLTCIELAGILCDDGNSCTEISSYSDDCTCASIYNAALQGEASMSSEFGNSGAFPASKANDGIKDSGFAHTSNNSLHEWIQIDLGKSESIEDLIIWNRQDPCCYNRLSQAYVIVSDNPFPNNTDLNAALSVADFSIQLGNINSVSAVPVSVDIIGRYVRIQKSGNNVGGNILNISEIQVFAKSPEPDSDNDGVCDFNDACPGFDDSFDTNNNGIPDHCEPIPESDCENILYLTGNEAYYHYQADNRIFSVQSIEGNEVRYSAGNQINLLENFEVVQGTVFEAIIEECNGSSN